MINENIIIEVENENECINNETEIFLSNMLNEFNENDLNQIQDLRTPLTLDYAENYTVKELLLICEYYGFAKEIKANKLGKDLLIQCLVDYELNSLNEAIVEKRKNMWFFINELKNDKFMKKFIIW